MSDRVQHVAKYDGAAVGEPDTPCPKYLQRVYIGELITPVPGSRYLWEHMNCENPTGEPQGCSNCGGQHSVADDCD